ncbi:hypothetical protein EG329_000956 [Mollisiaceae sp. DMI_Dod_QoI]|nr:hypothetical protein EG329_000956 [Helotiales sp. DMI_Dod_QoI]
MVTDKNTSILLFHGTCLKHLQSILREGFRAAFDTSRGKGLFMAENPGLSHQYAIHASGFYRKAEVGWKYDPYKSFGMLLGCEVTGKGRQVHGDGAGILVITTLDSIMIRYIFLLPVDEMSKWWNAKSTVQRNKIESNMKRAFKKIRAGQVSGLAADAAK